MSLTSAQLTSLSQMAEAAVAAERATGCPAELSVAQCILESGWLKVAPGNNCFGIKDTDRRPGCQYCITSEFQDGTWKKGKLAFEVYPDLSSCFTDHARLLTGGYGANRYSPAWQQYQKDHDLQRFIRALAAIYATDPAYAAKVVKLANGPNVAAAVVNARSRAENGGPAHRPA